MRGVNGISRQDFASPSSPSPGIVYRDKIQMPVVTCDMEFSSVGNAVVQLSHFCPEYSYDRLREIIVNSLKVKVFKPK